MSDTTTLDRETRTSALDAFARQGDRDEARGAATALTIPGTAFQAPAERVFGAQLVAKERDEGRVLQKLRALAAAAGDDWYYRYPVGTKDGVKEYVEGPSIKLANDLARMYGNCEVETKVMDLGDSWLIYARFTDFETGFSLTRPFQQRKSQKVMKTDSDRARDIAFQIGVSKAIRNVVVNALQTFADFAFEEAKNALVDRIGNNLVGYRTRTVEKLSGQIDIKRVELVIGRAAQEWLAPDVARVIALMKAVNDGMASLDETFPPLPKAEVEAGAEASAPGGLDQFAAGGEPAPADQGSGAVPTGGPEGGAGSSPQANDPAPASKSAPMRGATKDQAEADQVVQSDGTVTKDRDGEVPRKVDPVDFARQRGAQAFTRGTARTATPKEYREKGREAELDAYVEGYDTAQAEAVGDEG